ncbi:hypothetical protein P4518_10125, partial [Geobacillus thermodenitrificans]|uniref:hypothetical protein n=1 Tax=Geobacillus thermodenitrificans TaxID=33940 RepID=UPI002E21762D|nr:hypothetical protein [Geobacillus thermodenitrificans]
NIQSPVWRKSVPYQFKSISEKPYPITLHKILDGTEISKKTLVLFIKYNKYNLYRLNKISFKVRNNNNATTS